MIIMKYVKLERKMTSMCYFNVILFQVWHIIESIMGLRISPKAMAKCLNKSHIKICNQLDY